MAITQKIISEIYDEKTGKLIRRTIINEKPIKNPKTIDDVGYNKKEQIDIIKNTQDEYLSQMSKVIAGSASCKYCGGSTMGVSQIKCEFHALFTDHQIKLSRRKCKDCGRADNPTVYSLFGSNIHPDLLEKQSIIGSDHSYSKASSILNFDSGYTRTINNSYTINKTVEKVGKILDTIHKTPTENIDVQEAKRLVIQTDGGYVRDRNPKLKNFEVLITKIYNPINHQLGSINKHGKRISGTIDSKMYVANALKDRGVGIKSMTRIAAQKHGLSKNTEVTCLSDGAKNCWNVLKSLSEDCGTIEYVLDWYHIKQKFDSLYNKMDDPKSEELESIKWKIWHGYSSEAIQRLSALYINSLEAEYTDKLHDLLKYLTLNKKYLVSYEDRKQAKVPFTSSIIESAVETIINDRHKKKHKAEWSRHGAHNVLQIRTSRASQQWTNEWKQVKSKLYNVRKVA